MDPRLILLDRIQALRQELDRAKGAVEGIYPKLGKRVRSGFSGRFEDLQDRLINLQQGITGAPSHVLSQRWKSLQEMRRDECEPLFKECLALVQGSLVRGGGLDAGLCEIADALLYDLSYRTFITWGRFTILDLGESFGQMVEVIRVRFPEASIWSLPVAAHEFGHFVAPRLEVTDQTGKTRRPVQDLLDRERNDERRWHHLQELFADLFATYVLGPAYACTCILLRWDPWTAYDDGDRHPSDAKRVGWILKVLEEMNENTEGGEPTYWSIVEELRDAWKRSLRLAGQPESLGGYLDMERKGGGKQAIQQLDKWFVELYRAVGENNRLMDARYRERDWLRAQRMSTQLLEETPLVGREECTLADVLNAAWWCRIWHAAGDVRQLHRIGERAVRLCQEIIDRA